MNKNSGRKYEYINGKKVEVTPQVYAMQIRYCYKHWKDIYNNGCNDPFWCDGTNLNLVRNHIEYYRRKIEEMLGNVPSLSRRVFLV